MSSKSIVAINRIISVGTSVQAAPAGQRDFKNTVFIWKGARKGDSRINYVGTDLENIVTVYGSNSEAYKAAVTFLAGGFNGNAPQNLYIGNIDADATLNIAEGSLVYDVDNNYFTYSDLSPEVTAMLEAARTNNDPIYAEISDSTHTSMGTIVAYIMDDGLGHIKAYMTKTDYSLGAAINFAETYGFVGSEATTSMVLYKDALTEGLSEILGDSTCYLIGIDNTFSDAQKKVIMSAVEASTPSHVCAVLDTSADAAYKSALDDNASLAHYAHDLGLKRTAVVVDDAAKADEYKSMSFLSYYAQVNFTVASPMGSVMFKTMSGISASEFATGGVVTATAAWDNIVAKSANCFARFTEVYDTCWAKGTSASGHQFGEIIAGDFVDYRITFELFYMLRSVPKLPMTQGGANRIEQCMALAFDRLRDAGVIAGGVSESGEVFSELGYKVSATVPSGADKQQGIWTDVRGEGLLAGTTTKIVVSNTLKY